MEDPRTWNRVTAGLYLTLDERAERAWEFVVSEGWVVETFRPKFEEAVSSWASRAPRPGPSRASFLAGCLREAGAITAEGALADPYGKHAERRLAYRALQRGNLPAWLWRRGKARASARRARACSHPLVIFRG